MELTLLRAFLEARVGNRWGVATERESERGSTFDATHLRCVSWGAWVGFLRAILYMVTSNTFLPPDLELADP